MGYIRFEQGDKQIFLIDMRQEAGFPFCELVEKGLRKYLAQGRRVGILANKKGYASGIICQDCGHIPYCDACDIPIAFHKDQSDTTFGLCHICKAHYSDIGVCPHCQGHDLDLYGVGTQQIAELIDQQFGVKTALVESETANSPAKVERLLAEIADAQVLIGTSLFTQPVDGYPCDLIIVVQADKGLNIPDYQSSRQTFLYLYETFSRHTAPTFLVQTRKPEHRAIRHACALDSEAMRDEELARRKQQGYPPYTDMCVLLYKHEIESRLHTSTSKLHQELLYLQQHYEMNELEIFPTPPLIYKMFGKYRYHIILKGPHLKQFMEIIYSKLKLRSRGFKVDRQPSSLL